ncbi:hypothetical protein [Aureliella helgolandensis]|uniref:Uncharacterized protein n=1 Tax=Aureliella helgolandensis TaxID=2527968 RepID=A0A518GBG2_9BACT|nr:hypothetical protein [Aureliella helgolandensis]QDV25956.1 hypothetical protein Q31a_43260 [Aureliella helgolandensis]
MIREIYRYAFDKSVDAREAEATLLVAVIAAEALHGPSAIRMNGRYRFDATSRNCEIDGGSEVGQDLNRLYVGFLNREFGPSSFSVQRITAEPASS